MPRNRLRTTTRGEWSTETLEAAIKTIRDEGKSVHQVSQQSGIPYSTLKKRYRAAQNDDATYSRPPKLGRKPIFSAEDENTLAKHLLDMSKMFYGLTSSQFRKTVYASAVALGINHGFDDSKKMAGKDWLSGFLKRHPELSIRKAEATSINRIEGFNKAEIDRFFANLELEMTKNKFGPHQMYNMDESGFSTVQEPGKILAPKGEKRVGSLTSWERGKNVTVICAMSASGSFVPPLFIFPRKRHSPQLEKDGPAGAAYECTHNGWTNEEIFIKWLQHFAKNVKPSADNPILLILDNHNSHATKAAYDFCKQNFISMVSIPPHTSHRLQPLDVTFFSPLKKAYNRECDLYLKSKNMTKITPYEIAGLFNKAYAKVASLDKGISGFRCTGIFPMNPNIFNEEDFIVFQSNQQQREESSIVEPPVVTNNSSIDQTPTMPSPPNPNTDKRSQSPMPSTSRGAFDVQALKGQPLSSILNIVSPRPQIKSSTTKSRTKQHSEILTSTPMKLVFEEKLEKRKTKENKKPDAKSKKKDKNPKKVTQKVDAAKKQLFHTTSTEKSSDTSLDTSIDETILCDDNSDDDVDEESVKCMICNDIGKNNELWYRCRLCGQWAHAECSDSEDPENFYCDFCLKK